MIGICLLYKTVRDNVFRVDTLSIQIGKDTDETCQWYWYDSELFGIKASSEWSVDGNYF